MDKLDFKEGDIIAVHRLGCTEIFHVKTVENLFTELTLLDSVNASYVYGTDIPGVELVFTTMGIAEMLSNGDAEILPNPANYIAPTTVQPQQPKKCTCPFFDLLNYGCKCGGI